MSRRSLLARGSTTAAALMLPGVLAACGGDDGSAPSSSRGSLEGELTMMNYPDWIGKGEIAAFEKEFPGLTVRQVAGLTDGNAAAAAQVLRNEGTYDLSLANAALAGQLEEAGALESIDLERIPNAAGIAPTFTERYPWGVATDLGKVGIGYRSDIVSEEITSWADVWELAPKYSGQIDIVKFDADVLGMALLYTGSSVNSTDQAELDAARDALLELKPDIQAFRSTNIARPLVEGSSAITVSYDYDIAAAQQQNDDVIWVAPEEGMPGYLDGWVAIAGTQMLGAVEELMNFHLEPENYANFINTIGGSYVVPDAEPMIDDSITENPALRFDEAALERVEFEEFLGEGVAPRARIWEEVLAA